MYSRIILNFILILVIATFQLSLFSALPHPLDSVNIVLIAMVFVLILGGLELSLWWALGMGGILDFYSSLPFGTNIAALIASAFLLNFLLTSYLTNRSLYSFIALTALAVITFDIFRFLIPAVTDAYHGSGFFNDFSWNMANLEFKSIITNIATMIILFYFTNLLGQWLKPVFLIRGAK